jgi:hypothetical protein
MRATPPILAAALLFCTVGISAQVTNPDNLIGPAPKPPRQLHPQPIDDLQWLWQFAEPKPVGRANDLRLDERFQSMLAREFKQPQSLWQAPGGHESLASIIPIFLTRYGTVTASQNRYFTVDGCVPRFCPAAGLLWVDLGTAHPLMVFAAVNWSGEGHTTNETSALYNLWLFSNRELSPDQIPLALNDAIAQWDARLADAHRLVPHIEHALLVEPSGAPVALDPQLVGANTIAPQLDTTTPPDPDER